MDHQRRTHILLMGQTPPPWHGQAVATQILFDHDWPDFEVHRLRMEFSEEMEEVGRFQFRKLKHLFKLISQARDVLKAHPGTVLLYPPASAKWVPFLRDVIFLNTVRHLAGKTVFIFHASGLPVFSEKNWLTRLLSRRAYHGADVSLEVAIERLPPHQVFKAKNASWCPCAIEIGKAQRSIKNDRKFVALFVGSLQEGKGVLEILRTARLLKDRGLGEDFRFRIVGKWFSAEFEKDVIQMHEELGVGDMVELVGQLTGDDKWQAYADADVFFFPTHYASEATPIVIMEALGMGLPILSTQWAGIPAMLDGCGAAILLPIRSSAAYADALESLAREHSKLDRAPSESAIQFYREHFLPERFIGRVEEAFRLALASDEVSHKTRQNREESQSPITRISIYLADQNPKLGRSLGISRMTEVVLEEMLARDTMELRAIASSSSVKAPSGMSMRKLPWGTRRAFSRILTDHLHPLLMMGKDSEVWYYPKGYLPVLHTLCTPSVVTIHDTIVQHYADHHPKWRTVAEYRYWAGMLKHTLRHADHILTVSRAAKAQIEAFMDRYHLPAKTISVTYEPCLYEEVPQPINSPKGSYVLHLASREPHKRTAWLVNHWADAEKLGLPILHVVGTLPDEVILTVADNKYIRKFPFLDVGALQAQFTAAQALIFPSEIEGFGLPAIEAYYLGTPVCFVKSTSVEEVLEVATQAGGFVLSDDYSLNHAITEVLAMPPDEVYRIGIKLRETYAAAKIVDRMEEVFKIASKSSQQLHIGDSC